MAPAALQHPFEVLLVEDNPGDVRLTREVFRRVRVPANLSVVEDGEQALAFLRRQGPYERAPRPDLVLLDLNLPRINGTDVLSAIKNDVGLKRIPVVILTTSRSPHDIARSYELYANCYITK
ncbi:MAG: response regulator, partial [Armatimonadota bacterium]